MEALSSAPRVTLSLLLVQGMKAFGGREWTRRARSGRPCHGHTTRGSGKPRHGAIPSFLCCCALFVVLRCVVSSRATG